MYGAYIYFWVWSKCPFAPLLTQLYFIFSYRYYLKKRDTLATLIQDEVQQVRKIQFNLMWNYVLWFVCFQEMVKESKIHKQILKLDPLVIAQEFTRIVRLLYHHTLNSASMNCTHYSQ